jgi:hypothetical protein
MSATPHVSFLRSFFPHLQVETTPVGSPFPIQTHYQPMGCLGFAPYNVMAGHVGRVLQQHPGHKRVLVFLYTHEQCDKMAKGLKERVEAYHGGKTYALYGGMDKEEMQQWNTFLRTEECFVVFSTNVAETSLTIPNLSLVIDFGVRCVQRNHRVVYSHCPKSNLVQRAGRTGRTCPGVVVRCMREEDFHARPETGQAEYNWDMMVLLMLRHRHRPSRLLPEDVPIDSILQKFRFYRLVDEKGVLDRGLVSFVLRCPLRLKNSCHLYWFLEHNRDERVFALYLLSCALIDQMETRFSRIYYHSSDMPLTRHRLLGKIRGVFARHPDELVLHLHLVLSCMLNEKPVGFSNAFSLNFRTLRQIASATTRLWEFVHHHLGEPAPQTWQDALRSKTETKTALGWEDKEPYRVLWVRETYLDRLRHCYMINPLTPRFLVMNDMVWRPNFILSSHTFLVPFYKLNRCILVLSYDDTEVHQWFDPSQKLQDITTLSFTLYTSLPSPMDHFIKDIHNHVRVGYFGWRQMRKYRERTRKRFRPVLEDIEEDVAYRPGFWRMHTSLAEWFADFQKIKSCLRVGHEVSPQPRL